MTFRDLCPALANKTYFNYGGQGPLPTPSLEAMTASWQRIQERTPSLRCGPFISREVNSTRMALATLCGLLYSPGPERKRGQWLCIAAVGPSAEGRRSPVDQRL